jgi:hypothetical protein
MINEKMIEVDETKKYCEYTTVGLYEINFINLLKSLESENIKIDEFPAFLYILTRWINEAPRKRFYRDLQLKNKNVQMLSGENFFLEEGGDKIIDNLENTGKLAVYLRKELFGLETVPDVKEYAIDP